MTAKPDLIHISICFDTRYNLVKKYLGLKYRKYRKSEGDVVSFCTSMLGQMLPANGEVSSGFCRIWLELRLHKNSWAGKLGGKMRYANCQSKGFLQQKVGYKSGHGSLGTTLSV